MTQGARPDFGTPANNCDDLSSGQGICHPGEKGLVVAFLDGQIELAQMLLDSRFGVAWAEIRKRIGASLGSVATMRIGEKRSPNALAVISGCGNDVDRLKFGLSQDPAVHATVEKNTACRT